MLIKNKRGRLVILVVVGVFLLLFCITVLDSPEYSSKLARVTGDAMDWRSHFLAGLSSTNCGRVRVDQDPTQATQCALKANSEGHPFRVAYDVPAIDAAVAGGIVRKSDGKLLALEFFGCRTGCGFSMLEQRVFVSSCPQPSHLYVNPKGRLNCFRPQLSYPRGVMSPNSGPY
jgi:hypothetical protein